MPCGSSETCLEESICKIKPWGPRFSKASEHVFEAHWILWWRGVIPGALKSYIIQQEHHWKNNTLWNNYSLFYRIITCVSLVNMEINYTYFSVPLKRQPKNSVFSRKIPHRYQRRLLFSLRQRIRSDIVRLWRMLNFCSFLLLFIM